MLVALLGLLAPEERMETGGPLAVVCHPVTKLGPGVAFVGSSQDGLYRLRKASYLGRRGH